MPMTECYLTADYLHPKYKEYWGYNHWGWDLGNNDKTASILASGSGTVIKTGLDNVCGNVLIVRYDAVSDRDGKTYEVIARYLHLSTILCKPGDTVKRGQVIARMGNTGTVSSGPHLHIEFDTDTKYPANTPTVKGSNILKAGTSKTVVDPKLLLTIAARQELTLSKSAYGESEDVQLPMWVDLTAPAIDYKTLYLEERTAHNATKATLAAVSQGVRDLYAKL